MLHWHEGLMLMLMLIWHEGLMLMLILMLGRHEGLCWDLLKWHCLHQEQCHACMFQACDGCLKWT